MKEGRATDRRFQPDPSATSEVRAYSLNPSLTQTGAFQSMVPWDQDVFPGFRLWSNLRLKATWGSDRIAIAPPSTAPDGGESVQIAGITRFLIAADNPLLLLRIDG